MVEYEKLTTGYEFPPSSFTLDDKMVAAYLDAVEDASKVYEGGGLVPPMAIAALAMAAMAQGIVLPPGTIHVSQELEFVRTVTVGETLTSYARVNRNQQRGKFHMLMVGINVLNQAKEIVVSGETSFILPLS
ncbi:MAG: MaoC family dehydratase N-terminal domain-containing protein [Chloroflexota bacterium]